MFTYFKERVDLRIVFAALALSVIGLVSVYSATYDAHVARLLRGSSSILAAGIFVAAIVALLPFRTLQMSPFRRTSCRSPCWSRCCCSEGRCPGPRAGSISACSGLQPSEFAKITTVLALAAYLSRSDVSLQKLPEPCGRDGHRRSSRRR